MDPYQPYFHKEQKEERENVQDRIREKQVAFKNLFKVLKHTVKIRISLQVYFFLNRETKERLCEDREWDSALGSKLLYRGQFIG